MATVTGSGATQHAGEDYTLTCTVSGGETTATTTYQWLRNNLLLSGEISASLSFTPLRQTPPSSNGQYVCEAMRSGRTVRSREFTVTVTGKSVLYPFSCFNHVRANNLSKATLTADLPTIFACTLGPRVQNAWKMYPMLGIARRILSSRASNQFVGFISCSFSC